MDHKKDIGKLLKDRLQDAAKTPNKNLWERLDNSLEKREKKRRVAAWLWYGSAGILVLTLLFTGYKMSKQEVQQSEILVENTNNDLNTEHISEVDSAAKNKKSITENTKDDDTLLTDNDKLISKEITTNLSTKSAPSLKNSNNKQTTPPTKATKKAVVKNDPYADEGTVVKTSYQYYNSATDTTSVDLNQRQMDSLMKANTPVIKLNTIQTTQEINPTILQDTLLNY